MHEYSIVGSLIERVRSEARARQASSVGRVRVLLGELSGVDPELLSTAWEVFRERTLCAAAALEIRTVPARWVCPECRAALARGGILRCPSCGVPARLASGDEIVLEQIEMEVA